MTMNIVRAVFVTAIISVAAPTLAVVLVEAPHAAAGAPAHAISHVTVKPAPAKEEILLKVGGWLIVVVVFALIGGVSRRRSSRIVAS